MTRVEQVGGLEGGARRRLSERPEGGSTSVEAGSASGSCAGTSLRPMADGAGAATAALPHRSVFGELLVLRCAETEGGSGSGLPLTHAEPVARAVRGALLRHAVDPPPAALSGHTPDGRRLDRPHMAYLVLPDVCAPSVAGVAVALPRDIGPADRQAILLAAARWERSGLRLVLGRLGAMQLAREDAPRADDPLAPARWTGPSRRWASVTPIALHRNPGDLTSRDPAKAARAARQAEALIPPGCAHIGLPPPTRVRIARRAPCFSLPSAPEFMPFPRQAVRRNGRRLQRVCVHAELEFAEEVEGPVVLGAGRFMGIGLLGAVWSQNVGARQSPRA